MRLINARTYELETFLGKKPNYAILSHTWEEEEILFEHMTQSTESLEEMEGWYKVSRCCEQAIKDRLEYVWIDTCCIDKSSSAELSEAINSMFEWYASAEICYAYLSDLELPGDRSDYNLEASLKKCRWFTRGWTLQELIAPCQVWFFDADWRYVGKRDDARERDWQWNSQDRPIPRELSDITRIPRHVLSRGWVRWETTERLQALMERFSVSQRMNWAARRRTTRVEDEAYCLLGLFSINMPLLYGEGKKAFRRLQHEIVRGSNDQSIFATTEETLFASSPNGFVSRHAVELISLPRFHLASGHLDESFIETGPSVITMTLFICPLMDCSNYAMKYDLSNARLERVSIVHSSKASSFEVTRVNQWQVLSLRIQLAKHYKFLSYWPPEQPRLHRYNIDNAVVIELPETDMRVNHSSLFGIALVETPHGSNLLVGWGRVVAIVLDGEQGSLGCQLVETDQGRVDDQSDPLALYTAMLDGIRPKDLNLTARQELDDSARTAVWIEQREVLGYRHCDLHIESTLTSE